MLFGQIASDWSAAGSLISAITNIGFTALVSWWLLTKGLPAIVKQFEDCLTVLRKDARENLDVLRNDERENLERERDFHKEIVTLVSTKCQVDSLRCSVDEVKELIEQRLSLGTRQPRRNSGQ